jgi:glycosyltransferase involved in cell wall biosynthesis
MRFINIHKNFIIFGAGYLGETCCMFLKSNNRNILFFVDNDSSKWGKEFKGVSIKQPIDIKKTNPNDTIIIIASAQYEREIEDQLMYTGIYLKYQCIRWKDFGMMEIKPYYVQEDKSIHDDYPDTNGCGEILYDFQIFSMQNNGGISRYFAELIKRVAKNSNVDFFEGYNKNNNTLIREKNIFNRYYKKNLNNISLYKEILNCSLLHSFVGNRKYKVYHPTYYRDYGLENSKACIITVHDMIYELYNLDQRTILEKKNMIYKSDGIIVVSENTKSDLINLYNINEDKIQVIYEANSLSTVVTEPRIIKEPYILYVGNRDGYKNMETLLYAFARSRYKKDLSLVFFSGGELTQNEKHLLVHLKVEKRVKYMSGNDDILANLYKYAEVFVYPSLYEGFGLPVLEAMHYGTPVIVSDKASLPEVAGDAAVYFNPISVDELEECINSLLDDREQRERIKQAGILQEKKFSWDKCADEHIKFYQKFY